MRICSFLLAISVAGCGQTTANCEFDANGVGVCVDAGMGMGFCRKQFDGEATKANSSEDPTCADLGYEVDCGQRSIEEIGGNYEASHAYSAASEEDCDAADGAVVDNAGD